LLGPYRPSLSTHSLSQIEYEGYPKFPCAVDQTWDEWVVSNGDLDIGRALGSPTILEEDGLAMDSDLVPDSRNVGKVRLKHIHRVSICHTRRKGLF
jgi:hypothetical protein